MTEIMNLIFEHKKDIREQKYIDMCNCMKELYQMNSYVYAMKENNIIMKKYINEMLNEKILDLSAEESNMKQIKLPYATTELRYKTCLRTASDNDLIRTEIKVQTYVISNDKVNVMLIPRFYIGEIEITHFRLKDMEIKVFGIMPKNLPSNKDLKTIRSHLTSHGFEGEYLRNLKKLREEERVVAQSNICSDKIEPLIKRIEILRYIYESL